MNWRKTLVYAVAALVILSSSAALGSYLTNSVETQGTTYWAANSGVAVGVTGGPSVNATEFTKDNDTVWLRTSQGNITVSASGDTSVRVENINGTWTNVTNMNVSAANTVINPEDKLEVVAGKDIASLNYTAMAIDDGAADFVYSGTSGTSFVTVNGLQTNTKVYAIDTGNGKVLDNATTDGSGQATFDTLPNSEHTVSIQTSDDPPTLSDASPTGGQDSEPTELQVNVSDPELADNNNVTVHIWLDGSKLGNKTTSTNGTVSIAINSGLAGGSHEWTANATDSYDQWTNESYTFQVPDTLFIRNESNASQLVKNVTVEVKFFADDRVVTRNTTDGTINLTGMPVSEGLIARAQASGWGTRTVIIDSIYNQQSMFLVNTTNMNTVEVRFKLDDRTGNFDETESEVLILKAIELNGTTKFRRVVADEFGVEGVTTDLTEDRYRIKVRNKQGDTRVLGWYRATVSETVTLEVGELSFSAGGPDTYQWDAKFQNTSSPHISINYSDISEETGDMDIVIYERGNRTNNTIYNDTIAGPHGNISVTQPLTTNQTEKTWVVKWESTRNGESISGKRVVGKRTGLLGGLSDIWKHTISVGLLIVIGGLFGGVRAELGAMIVTIFALILWFIKWLPAEIGIGVLLLALAIPLLYKISSSREVVR